MLHSHVHCQYYYNKSRKDCTRYDILATLTMVINALWKIIPHTLVKFADVSGGTVAHNFNDKRFRNTGCHIAEANSH